MPMPKNQAYESAKDFCISPFEELPFEGPIADLYYQRVAERNGSTRNDLLNLHRSLCDASRETMANKNRDYATDADVFRNFRMFGGLGILVRASDKLARLRTFEERNEFSVSDESLRDTIEDLINYAVIYLAYKQEGK